MNKDNNYIVSQNDDNSITYVSYSNTEGFKVSPKVDGSIYDMVNVNEMIIINPSLIKKLINKKCNKKLEKIIILLNDLDNDDSGEEDGARKIQFIVDEIERFKRLILQKYGKYLTDKEVNLILKKIGILSSEINLRIEYFEESIKKRSGNRR